MPFTAAQYNLAASGVVPMLMARSARRRALILGTSFDNENNNHRGNEAWFLHAKPAGGFIGGWRGGRTNGSTPFQLTINANIAGGTAADPVTIAQVNGPTILGYTLAADCVVQTSAAHGLTSGWEVEIWNDASGAANKINGRRLCVVVDGTHYSFNPPLDTTVGYASATASFQGHRQNAHYPTPTKHLTPGASQALVWPAGDVANDAQCFALTFAPAQNNQNTLPNASTYALVPQAVSPMWWMKTLDWKFVYHEPSAGANGCDGSSFDVRLGNLFSAFAGSVKSGATQTSTNAGALRTRTDQQAAITDPRLVRQYWLSQPSAPFTPANNNNKQILPIGWLVEVAPVDASQGLSVVPLGHPQFRALDWGDPLLISDAGLTAALNAIGTFDVLVLHLGHNVTALEVAGLAASTTEFKANLQATITRIRAIVGNIPVLLISPSYHDPGSVMSTTRYGFMVDAMKETCDEMTRVGLINFHHNGGSPKLFTEDNLGMNVVATNGVTDLHFGQNGQAWEMSFVWEQLRIADEVLRSQAITGGGLGGGIRPLRPMR